MSRAPNPSHLVNTDPADFSTDDVIVAIRKGEIELYRQIVVRYQGDVLKIVNAMLLDYSAREDVVQQVFVRAFQRLEQYELGRGFGKWVKAIARNMVREELRKQYRYKGRLDAYAQQTIEDLEKEDELVDWESGKERSRALEECIASLEQHTSQAIKMHYVEGKRTDQVAADLGRTGGAVRTMLCRARGQLRKCLEGKGVLA